MDEALRDQVRYLELRLAECTARPALHRAQLAAYDRQLHMARSADSAIDYLRQLIATGTTMAITRAEWIDRYRNWGCVYRALGDEIRSQTADSNRQAAEKTASDHGLMAALLAIKARNSPIEHRADANQGHLHSLMAALLDWRITRDTPSVESRAQAVKALFAAMRDNDPRCTWARICTYPPYRHRLPFSDAKLARLGDWLEQVVGPDARAHDAAEELVTGQESVHTEGRPAGGPTPGSPGPAVSDLELAIPDARQAALAYHLTYDALDSADPANREVCALYELIFELEARAASGPAFLRAMAENDLYCRLARAPQLVDTRAALGRAAGQSQPHAEYHYRQLEQALLGCHSPTEVEYEVERAARMFAVEVAWNNILLGFVTRVLTAVSTQIAEPDEYRRRVVVASHQVLCELLDESWDGIMATPRFADMFERVWFARGRVLGAPFADGLGARFGELGSAPLFSLREASLQRIVEKSAQLEADGAPDIEERLVALRAGPAFSAPGEMRAYLDAGLHQALAGQAAPSGHARDRGEADSPPLVLWGRPVTLYRLHDELARPARPPVQLA